MTNRQRVDILRELGYDVKFYKRKDGGIRITSIKKDGFSFKTTSSSQSGNKKAAELIGSKLETKYTKALKLEKLKKLEKIKKQKALKRARERKKNRLTDAEKKLLKKVRKKLKQKGKKISTTTYKKRKKRAGARDAKKALKNTAIHLSGYCYPDQIRAFQERCEQSWALKESDLQRIKALLKPFIEGKLYFLDEDLKTCYDAIYEIDKTTTLASERAQHTANILNIITKNKANKVKDI